MNQLSTTDLQALADKIVSGSAQQVQYGDLPAVIIMIRAIMGSVGIDMHLDPTRDRMCTLYLRDGILSKKGV